MQKIPYIDVATPTTVQRGNLMAIFARFLDMNTFEPIKVSEIYLQIVSNYHEYWRSSLMRENVSVLQIAVPTIEMHDDDYVVKVSDHKEMLTFGFNRVHVKCPGLTFRNKNKVKIQMY